MMPYQCFLILRAEFKHTRDSCSSVRMSLVLNAKAFIKCVLEPLFQSCFAPWQESICVRDAPREWYTLDLRELLVSSFVNQLTQFNIGFDRVWLCVRRRVLCSVIFCFFLFNEIKLKNKYICASVEKPSIEARVSVTVDLRSPPTSSSSLILSAIIHV